MVISCSLMISWLRSMVLVAVYRRSFNSALLLELNYRGDKRLVFRKQKSEDQDGNPQFNHGTRC